VHVRARLECSLSCRRFTSIKFLNGRRLMGHGFCGAYSCRDRSGRPFFAAHWLRVSCLKLCSVRPSDDVENLMQSGRRAPMWPKCDLSHRSAQSLVRVASLRISPMFPRMSASGESPIAFSNSCTPKAAILKGRVGGLLGR